MAMPHCTIFVDSVCAVHYIAVRHGPDWPVRRTRAGPRAGRKGSAMLKNFEEFQKLGKDNVDVAVKQFGVVSKNFQAIATEVADYSKKSFEDGSAALEKLFGAKTLDKAIQIQSDYVKTAYEGFVAEATKLGALYTEIAKESCKPFEGFLAKVSPIK
jgi:hypothetical protein